MTPPDITLITLFLPLRYAYASAATPLLITFAITFIIAG
jgi:hypothetical protein